MNKKLGLCFALLFGSVMLFSQAVQPTTTKIRIEGRPEAYIYMTEIYKTPNWVEFYCKYVENKNSYREEDAEKIIYEYCANYKREHSFSGLTIDDVKGSSFNSDSNLASLEKRIVFTHSNRR